MKIINNFPGVYLFANPTEEDRAHSKYKTNSFQSSAEHQPINKPFPGFRPTINGKPTKLYTFFYLYIQPYFIVMAATCYIGRLLWRQLQGPLLLDIMGNLKRKKATRSQDRNDLRPSLDIEDAAHVLFQSVGQHNCFMLKYIVCQGINTLMVALHLVIITFIGGTNFWINGVKIFYYINVPYSEWPMEVAQKFPMVAKCDLRSYGPSGNEQVFDALCFMHFNHLVQFMFVIHWIASIITFLACLFSIYQLIRKLYCRHSRVQEILSVLYSHQGSDLSQFLHRLTPGTCFVIQLLAKNLSPHTVCDILVDLRMEIDANFMLYRDRLVGL